MINIPPQSESGATQHSAPQANRTALLVIFLTVFIDLVGFGIVVPLLPLYGDQFAIDPFGWKMGVFMASYSFMQFIFAPIWGSLSDRIGRRPIIILGISGSVLFYTLFGISALFKSFSGLLLARIGAGISGATIPTAQAYIADNTTNEDRTRGMALIGMAFGLGFALGPVFAFASISGSELEGLGAGPGFLAAGFSGVALLLAIFKLPEPKRKSNHERVPWWNLSVWKEAFSSRAIGLLIQAFFVCIFSFAIYETSLSILLKGSKDFVEAPFDFTVHQVIWTFAAIGILGAVYQGLVVRPMSRRVSTQNLAIIGAVLEVIGFLIVAVAARQASLQLLIISIFVIGGGYGFLQPSLFSLLSRWTDPNKQGTILGVGQSASAMARIMGALFAIPLIKANVSFPYLVAFGTMFIGLISIIYASKVGKDFASKNGEAVEKSS